MKLKDVVYQDGDRVHVVWHGGNYGEYILRFKNGMFVLMFEGPEGESLVGFLSDVREMRPA